MSSAAAASPAFLQNSPGGIEFLSNIQGAETTIGLTLNALLVSLENLAISLGKEAIIFLIIFGVLLYFSRLEARLGKRLLEGGIVIGVFITFVVPWLTTAAVSC